MSETAFTPGPWEVREGFSRCLEVAPVNKEPDGFGEPTHVAEIDDSYDEADANAALIAAAPDLYAELERARAWFQARLDGEAIGGTTLERLHAARAALAKARGE